MVTKFWPNLFVFLFAILDFRSIDAHMYNIKFENVFSVNISTLRTLFLKIQYPPIPFTHIDTFPFKCPNFPEMSFPTGFPTQISQNHTAIQA